MEESFVEFFLRTNFPGMYSEEKIQFIKEYKYMGKTVDEWVAEADKVIDDVDENGVPLWWEFMHNAEDALTVARFQNIKF